MVSIDENFVSCLLDVIFGYEGQPKLFTGLDFGISMESRGIGSGK